VGLKRLKKKKFEFAKLFDYEVVVSSVGQLRKIFESETFRYASRSEKFCDVLVKVKAYNWAPISVKLTVGLLGV